MASAGLILSRSQTADIDDRTPFDINDHFPFRLCWRKQYQSHKMTQMDTHTHTHTHICPLSFVCNRETAPGLSYFPSRVWLRTPVRALSLSICSSSPR